jgi:carbamate kinase
VTPRVVVALSASALSERGWPTLAEDPLGAVARAARSIAYAAIERSIVVTHCLSERTSALLRCHLEHQIGRPVPIASDPETIGSVAARGTVVLCAIGDIDSGAGDVASDLAVALDAEMLLVLIDTPVVWDGPADEVSSRAVRRASLDDLDSLTVDGGFATALEAAKRFVETTGRVAAVGAIDHLEAMVVGEGGTRIRADGAPAAFYGPQARST